MASAWLDSHGSRTVRAGDCGDNGLESVVVEEDGIDGRERWVIRWFDYRREKGGTVVENEVKDAGLMAGEREI
ncbi:unnamed protein product [Dovyalis caffra]|uniref:Uncharacterized protein n=1 Tax=Dovyalis caffra TaxID=77055 RepID=A0AAV1R942_9ROSI|nr:unnamed protein product [Dovyalis caffra]